MSLRLRHRPARPSSEGFTLIEMVVSIALSAVIMTALAGALATALRTLAVQKARTQGNEVATLGIESLQRLDYNALGVCQEAPNPPAGLTPAASPINCPVAAFTDSDGSDPCNVTTTYPGIPKSVYKCRRLNIDFDVRRYVAWTDASQTAKRLAVFVSWRDSVGEHTVSQQSSLRAPGQFDIVGLPAPRITSVTVNGNDPLVPLKEDGTLENSGGVTLVATVSGMKAGPSNVTGDRAYAVFNVLDGAEPPSPSTASQSLSSADGINWTGTIPQAAAHRFGTGSQFVTFSVIRKQDGKSSSLVSTGATRFCGPADPSCSSNTLPTFTAASAASSDGGSGVRVTSAGALVPESIVLSATTTNTSNLDSVSVVFPTRAGAVTTLLRPDLCNPVTFVCTWSGEIPQSAGYAFQTGARKLYFTVAQVVGAPPDQGSTAATDITVSFSL